MLSISAILPLFAVYTNALPAMSVMSAINAAFKAASLMAACPF
jgi:hypothetical protein